MQVPLNWLEEFVDLSGIDAQTIAEKLTLGLCEVEHIDEGQQAVQGVVVGEILEVAPHPQADRLRLARVTTGKDEELQIVCGAPNIEAGQKIPVAAIGAQLPGESEGDVFKIKKSKIRGVSSQGMLCSERELGLGQNHEGILILDDQLAVGTPLEQTPHLETPGATLTIDNKSLTHRSDCWGFIGLARELGAILNRSSKSYNDLELAELPAERVVDVDVQDHQGCPCYHAIKVSNLKVGSSPKRWQKKLESAGLRSINNIVDATNLVLLEIGQPLHAFDARFVKDQSIIVRRARDQEKLTTLDGVTRELNHNDLVIADGEKVLALAGIMGGEGSSVVDETTEILLEGAHFDSGVIRRSSVRLGLRSDSSARFEKGISPWLVSLGLRRCLAYLKQSCPELVIESGLGQEYSLTPEEIDVPLDLVSARLGCDLSFDQIDDYLSRIGFDCQQKEKNVHVKVPLWRGRQDIVASEDVIEEIGRLHGYTQIKPELPFCEVRPASLPLPRVLERRVRRVLADQCGAYEVLNYSFMSRQRCQQIGQNVDLLYRVKNPIHEERDLMRPTLLGGLLDVLATNHHNVDRFQLFEIGTVFLPSKEDLPEQKKNLAGLHRQGESSFHAGKRAIESLLLDWNVKKFSWQRVETAPSWAHPGRVAMLKVVMGKEKVALAILGEVHPKILSEEGVEGRVALWELDLSLIKRVPVIQKQFEPLAKYPAVLRDMAIVVDETTTVDEITQTLTQGQRLLKKCELFDIYRGQGLEQGKKSLAFHLHWQHHNKTLTDDEIDKHEDRLINMFKEKGWSRR